MPTEGNIYSFLEISPSVAFADGVFLWLVACTARRDHDINNIVAPERVFTRSGNSKLLFLSNFESTASRAALRLNKKLKK